VHLSRLLAIVSRLHNRSEKRRSANLRLLSRLGFSASTSAFSHSVKLQRKRRYVSQPFLIACNQLCNNALDCGGPRSVAYGFRQCETRVSTNCAPADGQRDACRRENVARSPTEDPLITLSRHPRADENIFDFVSKNARRRIRPAPKRWD